MEGSLSLEDLEAIYRVAVRRGEEASLSMERELVTLSVTFRNKALVKGSLQTVAEL